MNNLLRFCTPLPPRHVFSLCSPWRGQATPTPLPLFAVFHSKFAQNYADQLRPNQSATHLGSDTLQPLDAACITRACDSSHIQSSLNASYSKSACEMDHFRLRL